jgi:hypothetical protein
MIENLRRSGLIGAAEAVSLPATIRIQVRDVRTNRSPALPAVAPFSKNCTLQS